MDEQCVIIEELKKSIKKKEPSSIVTLERYYLIGNSLLQQTEKYRSIGDTKNVYVFLTRFTSLMLDTIPKHPRFNIKDQGYHILCKKLKDQYLPELEKITERLKNKDSLYVRDSQTVSENSSRSVLTSSLCEIDWNKSGAPNKTALPPHSTDASMLPSKGSLEAPPQFTSRYSKKASGSTREKHLLYGISENSQKIDILERPAVVYPSLKNGIIDDLTTKYGVSSIDQDLLISSPPRELDLPPQELEVTKVESAHHSHIVNQSPVTDAVSAISLVRDGIRDIHLSLELLETFLKLSKPNTAREIETCAILAGNLNASENVFTISNLLFPPQKGTRDQVEMINEERLLEEVLTKGLIVLGWIHTHPIYQCFMSSIDVHTALPYQLLLDEAVSIVMAPTDTKKKCGVFRLSTPGGLELISKCQYRGFHQHPETVSGQPIYENCSHVFINEKIRVVISDLR